MSGIEEEVTSEANQAIVGGNQATPGEYPWQARLSVIIAGQGYLCGGSLIANNWVLTAAHCMMDENGVRASSIGVVLGDHDAATAETSEQTRSAVRYVVHPDYDAVNIRNDIALVQLATPVTLNSRVATIPIATQSSAVGTTTTATGWGLVGASPMWENVVGGPYYVYEDGTPVRIPTTTSLLMEVSTPIASNATCQPSFDVTLQDSMMCAGVPASTWYENGKGSCSGDSGGPLVVKASNGTSTLVGITSFGSYFCSSYSLYTRVSSYASWITAVQNAATRSGMTWGKFTADDGYLDPLSNRGVDRLGCWGQPLINGSSCNAYNGDTACTEARPILCVKQDNSPRPAYKLFGGEYYSGWVNGAFALTQPISGLLLTSRAAGDSFCARSLGTGWRMVEHHDGKYVAGMSETAYTGATWTAAAASQQLGGWNGFGHGNVSATSRFWVAINDQNANCWGR